MPFAKNDNQGTPYISDFNTSSSKFLNSFIFGKKNYKIVLKDDTFLTLNQSLNQLKDLTIIYIYDNQPNNILSWIKLIKNNFSDKTSNKRLYNKIKKDILKNLNLSSDQKIHILIDKNSNLLQKCAFYLAINQLRSYHNNFNF